LTCNTPLYPIPRLIVVRPGYIAGVTNPLFENHPEWWDLLLNVDTGRIRISSQIPPVTTPVPELLPSPPSTDPSGDITFMEEIQYMIQNRVSEAFIRNRFKDWLWRFIRKAGSYEEMMYGETIVGPESEKGFIIPGHGLVWPDEASKMRELGASQMRFEGWRGGVTYHFLSKVVGLTVWKLM
jgi:Stabilization of polarity axis